MILIQDVANSINYYLLTHGVPNAYHGWLREDMTIPCVCNYLPMLDNVETLCYGNTVGEDPITHATIYAKKKTGRIFLYCFGDDRNLLLTLVQTVKGALSNTNLTPKTIKVRDFATDTDMDIGISILKIIDNGVEIENTVSDFTKVKLTLTVEFISG